MNKENLEQILEMQEENYTNRIGTVFGIFKIDNIKYNWITHTQEWVITCIKCNHSETVPKSIGWDWQRGKGRSQYRCKHCKEIEQNKQKQIKTERNKERDRAENEKNNIIGKTINGWIVNTRNDSLFVCNCSVCGRERKLSYPDIINNKKPCKMCDRIDFSAPSFIGKRYGNLTVIGYSNGEFLTKCDCGFEKTFKCSAINNNKVITCGRIECEYHNKAIDYLGKHGDIVRQVGIKSENEIFDRLISLGCRIEQTKCSADYGVDLICFGRNGDRFAIQVKNNKTTNARTNVHAVMEVYSGAAFYDCNKSAVISYTGYTDNAKKMAEKLGVLLCDEKCHIYDFSNKHHFNTKYVWDVNGNTEPMIDTFRKEGWNISDLRKFINMTYEQVKEWHKNLEIRRSQVQYCKEHNISMPYIEYRMKHMDMTFEQAINEPKRTMGRPRKQGVAV